MSLIVTAPDLVTVAFSDTKAARIVAALAAEGRSFYFEPWPNGRARISVNREHLGALQAHADEAGSFSPSKEPGMKVKTAGEMFIIYSPNESATSEGAGFWNNEDGWTTFSGATKFTSTEIGELKLPISLGGDAKWASESQAEASYAEYDKALDEAEATARRPRSRG
jgi:hypothetical protein